MTKPEISQLVERLLLQLGREEEQLREAIVRAREVYETLRSGNMPGMMQVLPKQERLAEDLRVCAEERTEAANQLAQFLGIESSRVTLVNLAQQLPANYRAALLASRETLKELSAELISFQQSNANLIQHLRCYFRGVLSGLTSGELPSRYGPSGARVEFPAGTMVLARG